MLFLLVFALSVIGSFFVPVWWSFVPIAFLSALFFGRGKAASFRSGFFAVALAWLVLILFRSIPNDNILAARMAHFFMLPHWSVFILLVSCLSGGLGGFSSFCGYTVKRVLKSRHI